MSEVRKGLFHDWVPKPVGLLVIVFLTLVVLTTNGLYTANITDMVGGLGTMAEYLTMANFASSIGMVVVFPILFQVKSLLKGRHILLISLSGTAALTLLCAMTTHPEVMIAANFLLGALKMFAMIEVIIPVMMIISPDGNRGRFYAIFYPISIVSGQVSAYFTAQLAYDYNWQLVYYFMLPGLLLGLALVVIFYHNGRTMPKAPWAGMDWLSLGLLGATLMLLNYILCFARVEDYFNSVNIQGACIGFVVGVLWFAKRQFSLPKPFIDLTILKRRNVWGSLLLVFLMGLFMGTGSIQSALTVGILKFNPMTNAQINLWMIPGIIVGGVFMFFANKYEWSFKQMVLVGFFAYILAHMVMYMNVHPGAGVQDFYLASALKGVGMVILFASLGLYASDKLQMLEMFAASTFLIIVRSFIGPAFFSAVMSCGMYHGQIDNLQQLAQNMDALNPNVVARFLGSGVLGLYGSATAQAILLTAQEMLGWVVLAGGGIVLFVLLFRFGMVNRRAMVNIRKKWRSAVAFQAITS
ncbi:MFS transporter [Rufibacter sp. XAAS-G3-1]|uniref:MFS transporter n=1 Tax=Rufibacter sp. XAAS-G3-1 TaxID=2729134 RepID=UPI0015E7C3A1|nr:MFS transporter [Rufibacter sp. XAAS-G3-1]